MSSRPCGVSYGRNDTVESIRVKAANHSDIASPVEGWVSVTLSEFIPQSQSAMRYVELVLLLEAGRPRPAIQFGAAGARRLHLETGRPRHQLRSPAFIPHPLRGANILRSNPPILVHHLVHIQLDVMSAEQSVGLLQVKKGSPRKMPAPECFQLR